MAAVPIDAHLRRVLVAMCNEVDSPVSLAVKKALDVGDWVGLVNMRVRPVDYSDSDSYLKDNALVELLRKCGDLPTGIDTRSVAVQAFWDCERSCYSTNERLNPLLWSAYPLADEWGVLGSILDRARKILRHLLGIPPVKDRILGRFGKGATFDDKGLRATVADKMSSRPTLTLDAGAFILPWSNCAWARACVQSSREPVIVPGNRFETVPKDATKDRGICIEPSINIFYQLGVGKLMKKRLKLFGIDLRHGQERHAEMACLASVSGRYATIDLSNASDTVSRALVKLLLPNDWFTLLNSLRSPKTRVDGNWVVLEKFSSMGNGFTFELETAIFFALAKAVLEVGFSDSGEEDSEILAYGDDIIVPTRCAGVLLEVLRFCGFSPNQRKTFIDGRFRESCGGDFFDGKPVRAHYVEEYPDEPQKLIALANGLRRLRSQLGDRFFLKPWLMTLDAIPSVIRSCRGPEELGDLVIHDTEEHWSTRVSDSIRYIKVYRPVTRGSIPWAHWTPDVVHACALSGYGEGSVSQIYLQKGELVVRSRPGGVTPRDSVSGYKVGWVPFS